ncbi:MAG: peptidase M3, partial [Bacteroidaceae bacterium]|nr:peptidase M3 [Bacteroidaceae bacterium]
MTALSLALCGCSTQQPKEQGNPFFSEFDTPHGIAPFADITIEHYREGILKGMEEQKAEIEAIINNAEEATFENTIVALDQSGQLLRKVRGTFSPLSSSNSNDEFRALQKEMSPLSSAHNDDIYLNEKLFARVKSVYDSRESLSLTAEQAKVLENIYDRFVNSGAELNDAEKARLRELNKEISMLQLEFSQNLLHETNNTFVVAESLDELKGLPQANIDAAAKMAEENGQPGKWMFNMQRPSCNPVLQYCENRELRRKVYEAYYNRGNQDNEHDSKEICARIVALRLEKAKLMGYENYAQMALKDRMASTPEAVYDLLMQVWEPAVAKAKEEIEDIRA